MNEDIIAARINRASQLLDDCREIIRAVSNRKRIPKSRVKKLESYRLFFQSIKDDPVFARLADCSLRLLDEHLTLVALYNTQGDSAELREKMAQRFRELMKERAEIMNEIKRRVGLNGF
jgi:hypothetical protein